jgi:polar amino acid transport system substrate-binding protein
LTGRAAAGLLGLVVLTMGCSVDNANNSSSGLPSATSKPLLATSPMTAPAGLARPGFLTVAADPTEAPLVYYDHNNRFAGFSIELLGALASQAGLRLDVINIDGGQIVPGLADPQHRYDLGLAAQPATPELSSEALTLQYLVGGQAILVRRDDTRIKSLDGLCGRTVGARKGGPGETAVLRSNEASCKVDRIVYTAYDDDVRGVHELQAGTVDAYVDDYSVATAFARLYPDIRVVPHHFNSAPEVFVFALTNSALHDAVAQAFNRVRADGEYKKLLQRWALEEGAVS